MNGGDQALNFIYLIGCLVLVGSALMVRRLPLGQSVRMVLAWLLIFAAAFVAFTLKDDFLALGQPRDGRAARATTSSRRSGGEIRIRRADDGHFWVNGEVNGRPVRFLVDSGATVTTLEPRHRRARRHRARATASASWSSTANGTTMVDRGRRRADQGRADRARRPRRPHRAGRRRHQRHRHELPVDLVRLGRRGQHVGAEVVTEGPSASLCILHNVYYRTY